MENYIIESGDQILITGSSGFIGAKVVETLLSYGLVNLRCFVRPSSRLDRLDHVIARSSDSTRVRIIKGDLLSRADCREAVDGVSVIYHLAAGMEKSFAGAFMNSALATRNLMEAALRSPQLKRFVNVSSFAVYSNRAMRRGALLDETSPLEDSFQARCDAYGFGKMKQEELVREYGAKENLPFVILRPGAVFGPGKRDLSGRVGVNTFGFFLHLGGKNQLPLTYVDNCAEAIVLAGLVPGIDGETFNVVDDEPLRSRDLFKAYRSKQPNLTSVSLPYSLTYGLSYLWERYSNWSQNQIPPVFNRRRCSAEWKGNRYSNQKLKEALGWRPRISMSQALGFFLAQFDHG